MNDNIPPEVTKKILEAFNQAGSANINTLQQIRDVQVVMGSLLQHETKRLEKKLGKDNLRVQQVQASIKRNQTITRDLEAELEIAKIRVPEVDPKGSLIHGRIADENRRGWLGLVVSLADVRGNIVHALGNVKTNSSGYYALPIEAETLKRVAESIKGGLLVVVCNSKGEIIYRHKDPVILEGGDSHLVEIVLKRSDLTPPPDETPSVSVEVLALDVPKQLIVKQSGTFTATLNSDATSPITYSWNFGDKTTASTLTATHQYSNAGDFTVTLTASNALGSDSRSASVSVSELSPDVWVVRGQVVDEEGKGISGLVVSLFDRDCIFDDRLGTTQTNTEGNFSLFYQTQDFRDLFEACPDLYIKVMDSQSNILYSSEGVVRYEAGRVEVFNIPLSSRANNFD